MDGVEYGYEICDWQYYHIAISYKDKIIDRYKLIVWIRVRPTAETRHTLLVGGEIITQKLLHW